MNLGQPDASASAADRSPLPANAQALVATEESLALRRRLGPLAWSTLQHMALGSHRTERGWAVPMGVRDIAAGIAVTKDTAARAVSRLTRAGLVTRTQVEVLGGGRRSGYLLALPDSLRLIGSPTTSRQPPRGRPALTSFINSDAIATRPLGGHDDD